MVTILACIFVFGILITVHEFGHFITAKWMGMRVDEFAIGFGPKLYSSKEGETQYTLRALPLGGFNRIAGMEPGEDMDDPRGYNSKAVPARMLVILAGSLMNLLLPIAIFWGMFVFSGVELPTNEPVLGQVVEHYPAAVGGLKTGDRIVSIAGKPVESWDQVRSIIAAEGENPTKVAISREGKELNYTIKPTKNPDTGKPFWGVVAATKNQTLGVFESVTTAVKFTFGIVLSMLHGLYNMITGTVSPEVAGPIGVAKMAGEAAHRSLETLLQFVALLSINLAVINLLPLPALDGGHFIILLVEGFTGYRLGEKGYLRIQKAGIIMILAITIFSTYKDIMRFGQ